MELLPSFLHARFSAAAQLIFPCLPTIVSGHSSTLCGQLKAPPSPEHSVNVDSLHMSHADIFISQARTAGGSPRQRKLTVEDVFWELTYTYIFSTNTETNLNIIRQEDGARKAARNATANVDDPDSQPAGQLLNVPHDEHLEEHGYDQLQETAKKQSSRNTQTTNTEVMTSSVAT